MLIRLSREMDSTPCSCEYCYIICQTISLWIARLNWALLQINVPIMGIMSYYGLLCPIVSGIMCIHLQVPSCNDPYDLKPWISMCAS